MANPQSSDDQSNQPARQSSDAGQDARRERPSQAEGGRDTGGPGVDSAQDKDKGKDPGARERPSQAEGDRDKGR